MAYQFTYFTNLGKLTIIEEDKKIAEIIKGEVELHEVKETELIKETQQQISEYFKKQRQYFDVPLKLVGTPFQVSVWQEIIKIPYGETRSYQDIAKAIGKPNAYRAVGSATRMANKSILIPCHRVIKAGGKLGKFGDSLDLKIELLRFERDE
ncbi:methylated-DNA--[protein]-cysteine S-methyltransferase [Erysipelotrichaceae bacterium OttesenSCG-928-M19]|nr:methylated-DNA--[protein]-cysteine S-methyltransferase [Erysipelotrichaceae bacterium OttesenSCG-928-M19]